MLKRIGVAVFAAMTFPAAAWASQPGWYVAIDGGQAHYNGIAGDVLQWIAFTPAPPPGMVIGSLRPSLHHSESNGAGYRLTIGYHFNRYVSVEGSYVNFANVRANGDVQVGMTAANPFTPIEAVATYTDAAMLRAYGWDLAAVASWPLSPRWSLSGRIGIFDSHTRLDIVSTPAPPYFAGPPTSTSESDSSAEPTFGVGVSFSPFNHWAARLDWDRYAHMGDRDTIMGRFNVNLVSLGVVYTL